MNVKIVHNTLAHGLSSAIRIPELAKPADLEQGTVVHTKPANLTKIAQISSRPKPVKTQLFVLTADKYLPFAQLLMYVSLIPATAKIVQQILVFVHHPMSALTATARTVPKPLNSVEDLDNVLTASAICQNAKLLKTVQEVRPVSKELAFKLPAVMSSL